MATSAGCSVIDLGSSKVVFEDDVMVRVDGVTRCCWVDRLVWLL